MGERNTVKKITLEKFEKIPISPNKFRNHAVSYCESGTHRSDLNSAKIFSLRLSDKIYMNPLQVAETEIFGTNLRNNLDHFHASVISKILGLIYLVLIFQLPGLL